MMEQDLVIGWKSIARLFGRSERHARRLHRRYGLPAFKIGRSVYCSKLAVALWSLDLASKQRAEWSARAAAARPTPAVMNDFVRNQMGEMLRARLKMAVEQQGRRPAPAAAH
jgi:hypothetical protein